MLNRLLLLFVVLTGSPSALANDVILTVYGSKGSPISSYSLIQLQQLPQQTIVTKHNWTSVERTYVGPLLSDILAASKATSSVITLRALNDYEVTFDLDEISQYGPILAWQEDGKTLEVRTLGPLRMMLPIDKYPELKGDTYFKYMIWNLHQVELN